MRIGAPGREDGAYAAVCGRLAALEKRLLGAAAIEECLAARDAASVAELLARRGILAAGEEPLPARWEEALELGAAADDRLLLRMDPRPAVSLALLARHDLANVRGEIRAKALGREYDGPWHPRGTLPREELARTGAAWAGRLPPELGDAVRRLAVAGSPVHLREIDDRLDAAWLRAVRAAAAAAGSRFFLDWLGHFADLANVRARLRFLAAPEAWPGPAPALLPGGHLDPGRLDAAGGAEALRRRLARTVYGALLARATEADGPLSLSRLDREADDLLTGLLRPARLLALGPERLWAWHLAHDVDAKNARALMLGKLGRLPPERIRPLLRLPHVA